ncbi:hypothetical protein ILYODFUR_005399, partial [Ilyodon furcidens]
TKTTCYCLTIICINLVLHTNNDVAQLQADYDLFFRQGAGEGRSRAIESIGNQPFLTGPAPPQRNQAGPGHKPHSTLLADKTPWKKKSANHHPELPQYISAVELVSETLHG